ncbi:IMEF encapsulin system ferritin-like cargo protein [Schinkia sp. CFF1]
MTNEIMKELEELFIRTENAVARFMEMVQSKIETAGDEHQHLYWHHIYEEEEQRMDRLQDLLPRVNFYINNHGNQSINNLEFIHLLQDISLEKFGLHNFEEHLDLALFDQHGGGALEEELRAMRQMTETDYERMKEILISLNQTFDGAANRAGSTPTDEKEHVHDHLKIEKFVSNSKSNQDFSQAPPAASHKKLTVGSLKYQ